MVSESFKKLFSIDCVNIYFSPLIVHHLFSIDFKVWVTPHCLYRDSLTLSYLFILIYLFYLKHFEFYGALFVLMQSCKLFPLTAFLKSTQQCVQNLQIK